MDYGISYPVFATPEGIRKTRNLERVLLIRMKYVDRYVDFLQKIVKKEAERFLREYNNRDYKQSQFPSFNEFILRFQRKNKPRVNFFNPINDVQKLVRHRLMKSDLDMQIAYHADIYREIKKYNSISVNKYFEKNIRGNKNPSFQLCRFKEELASNEFTIKKTNKWAFTPRYARKNLNAMSKGITKGNFPKKNLENLKNNPLLNQKQMFQNIEEHFSLPFSIFYR